MSITIDEIREHMHHISSHPNSDHESCTEVMLVRRGWEAAQEYPGRTIAKVAECTGFRPVTLLGHRIRVSLTFGVLL